MLVAVASVLTMVSLAGLLFAGQFGILSLYFSKPIIDATWDSSFAGVNLLHIIGVLFPAIVIIRSLGEKVKLWEMPLFKIWMIYVVYSAFTFSFLAIDKSIVKWFELTFRVMNGLAGFYVLQAYFRDRDTLRMLLTVLILAGMFPLLVGLYQLQTGQIWREHMTVGLVRHQGLYHSVISLKIFVFQTITSLLLYLHYFSRDRISFVRKGFLAITAILCVVVLYKTYSKSAFVIAILWFFIWAISFRRVLHAAAFLIVLLFVSTFYYQDIVDETTQLFSKEITVVEAENLDDYALNRTFAGRTKFWILAIQDYLDRPFIEQLIGNGNSADIHNDFLAKLLSGGAVGLTIYLTLIFLVGKALLRNWRKRRTPLDVMALMVLVMLIVDSMGIEVTQYTTYQWYAWGFIGLALAGVKSAESPRIPRKTNARGVLGDQGTLEFPSRRASTGRDGGSWSRTARFTADPSRPEKRFDRPLQ